MPVVAGDLKKYQSANMPESDSTTSGGAISTVGILAAFVQASNTAPKAASSSAGDTMTLTITGRLASTGAIDSEAISLTGTSQITFTKTFERILKAVLASGPAGNVTIFMNDGSTPIVVIPIGKTSCRRLFYDAASEGSGTTRYEKEYWKNENGLLTLNNAVLRLTVDAGEDGSHDIQVGVESAGSQSVTNRKTAPGGVSFVDENVDISISSLAAGASIGLWVRLTLGAGAAAIKSTYTTELAGTTV